MAASSTEQNSEIENLKSENNELKTKLAKAVEHQIEMAAKRESEQDSKIAWLGMKINLSRE